MHYIQKYILDKLIFAESLRNRDMRPPHTESNLYQYHLKRLVDSGYIQHIDGTYTLSGKGLQYADRHSSDLKEQRPQPKLVTILRLENERGEVLLVPRKKQPFIGMYNLPSGKIHEGETLLEAGQRELREKVVTADCFALTAAGTVHLTIRGRDSVIISESYGFILKGRLGSIPQNPKFFWHTLTDDMQLMPGVKEVLASTGVIVELSIENHRHIC